MAVSEVYNNSNEEFNNERLQQQADQLSIRKSCKTHGETLSRESICDI